MNNYSTKIEAIKDDSNGFKLIAFSRVINFPKCKPQVSPCEFADYKDGTLRIFYRGGFTESIHAGFKAALKYIFSL